MRTLCFLAAALLLFVPAATAVPVTWTLDSVSFNDGGTASGWFIADADAPAVTSFEISVAGGNTANFPEFTYTSASVGQSAAFNPFIVIFHSGDSSQFGVERQLRLAFVTALTNAGGTVLLDVTSPAMSECYNCSPYRAVTGAVTSVEAVPEPATMLLILIPLAIGSVRRRHRL